MNARTTIYLLCFLVLFCNIDNSTGTFGVCKNDCKNIKNICVNFEIILLLQILENTNNALRFQCRLRCVSWSSGLLSWLDSRYFQRATSFSAFVSCKDRVFLGPRPCNQIFPLAGLLFGWVLICHNWQQTIVTSQLSNTNCHFTFITDKIERIKHFLKRLSRLFDIIRKLFYIQSYKV